MPNTCFMYAWIHAWYDFLCVFTFACHFIYKTLKMGLASICHHHISIYNLTNGEYLWKMTVSPLVLLYQLVPSALFHHGVPTKHSPEVWESSVWNQSYTDQQRSTYCLFLSLICCLTVGPLCPRGPDFPAVPCLWERIMWINGKFKN